MSATTARKHIRCRRKMHSASAERNKEPILQVLKDVIKVPSESGEFPNVRILEIASGTGQHICHFAKYLSKSIFWQPSEYDKNNFHSICAYIQEHKLENVAPPVFIDIRQPFTSWNPVCETNRISTIKPITKFEEKSFDYIYNSNMIHISSFDCTEGLFRNSGRLLKSNGCLITYGPYGQNGEWFAVDFIDCSLVEPSMQKSAAKGVITPESNVRFDAGLRSTDPSWGVRDIQLQLMPLAAKNGLTLVRIIDMPANNKVLIWTKQ